MYNTHTHTRTHKNIEHGKFGVMLMTVSFSISTFDWAPKSIQRFEITPLRINANRLVVWVRDLNLNCTVIQFSLVRQSAERYPNTATTTEKGHSNVFSGFFSAFLFLKHMELTVCFYRLPIGVNAFEVRKR